MKTRRCLCLVALLIATCLSVGCSSSSQASGFAGREQMLVGEWLSPPSNSEIGAVLIGLDIGSDHNFEMTLYAKGAGTEWGAASMARGSVDILSGELRQNVPNDLGVCCKAWIIRRISDNKISIQLIEDAGDIPKNPELQTLIKIDLKPDN